MEFCEIITNLNSSPIFEKYEYEDSDHIIWKLVDSKSDSVEVTACMNILGIRENKYLEMVKTADAGYTIQVRDDICHLKYKAYIRKNRDIFREIMKIGASILAVSLLLERMC